MPSRSATSGARWIAETENVNAGEPDGTRDAIAILAQAIECCVGRLRQIHFRAGD